jgi:hypothetical protein
MWMPRWLWQLQQWMRHEMWLRCGLCGSRPEVRCSSTKVWLRRWLCGSRPEVRLRRRLWRCRPEVWLRRRLWRWQRLRLQEQLQRLQQRLPVALPSVPAGPTVCLQQVLPLAVQRLRQWLRQGRL